MQLIEVDAIFRSAFLVYISDIIQHRPCHKIFTVPHVKAELCELHQCVVHNPFDVVEAATMSPYTISSGWFVKTQLSVLCQPSCP
jgi:hypothetical protein